MTIELDDDAVAFWFVTLPPHDDFFAGVKKPGILEYRFRYNHPERTDPFDERDRKSWWRVEGPVEKLIEAMSRLSRLMAETSGGERWELLRGEGTLEQFIAEFRKLPFVFMKFEEP